MTKKELENAVKEGRAEVLHVLGKDADKISNDTLMKILLNAKEFICEDGEHYGENDVDLSLIFDNTDHEYIEYLKSLADEHDGEVPDFYDKELDVNVEQSL